MENGGQHGGDHRADSQADRHNWRWFEAGRGVGVVKHALDVGEKKMKLLQQKKNGSGGSTKLRIQNGGLAALARTASARAGRAGGATYQGEAKSRQQNRAQTDRHNLAALALGFASGARV